MKTCSMDLRERIVAAREEGYSGADARSFEELFNAVAYATQSFPSAHCTGFFRHANYATD